MYDVYFFVTKAPFFHQGWLWLKGSPRIEKHAGFYDYYDLS
jgi:hypothetical protein